MTISRVGEIIAKLAIVGLASVTLVATGVEDLLGAAGVGLKSNSVHAGLDDFAKIAKPNYASTVTSAGLQPTIENALADGQTLTGRHVRMQLRRIQTTGAYEVSTTDNSINVPTKFRHKPGSTDYFIRLNAEQYLTEKNATGKKGIYKATSPRDKKYLVYSELVATPYKYSDILMATEENDTNYYIDFGTYGVETVNQYMPIDGKAVYKGEAFVSVSQAQDIETIDTYTGILTLDTDFTKGKITGRISDIYSTTEEVEGNLLISMPLNQIVNNGGPNNPLGDDNHFSAKITSDAELQYYLEENLYGEMKGRFYGPGAVETAGTIILRSNGSNQNRGAGGFIAQKQ